MPPRPSIAAIPDQGKCLYYREWNRPQNTLENAADEGEEQRLMFGMLYSLKVSGHPPPSSPSHSLSYKSRRSRPVLTHLSCSEFRILRAGTVIRGTRQASLPEIYYPCLLKTPIYRSRSHRQCRCDATVLPHE